MPKRCISATCYQQCIDRPPHYGYYIADMNRAPQCTFEVNLNGCWRPAATMELMGGVEFGVDSATRIAYLIEHALDFFGQKDAAALSATLPVSLDLLRLPAWAAFAVDLLPQGYGRQELARHLGIGAGTRSADWPLLLAGAGNPIGNLRVAEAAAYVQAQAAVVSRGFTQEEIVSRAGTFMEHLAGEGYFVAGSSGVQGEWPKILLTQDRSGLWRLDHLLPDEAAAKHWIVKFARGDGAAFRSILEMEAAYYRVAADLGLRTAEPPIFDNGVLFIPRFDREVTQRRVFRIGQESLYSLAGKAGFDASLTHNQACAAIAAHCTDPVADITEYVLRDVANIALGNKDNHGRNSAFQRFGNGRVALSPLYDFAPMFLHPEGIARRIRWEKDDGGSPAWGSVAEQAASAGSIDALRLRRRLADFAEPVARLPESLERQGAPPGIIERLYPGIVANAAQLRDAAPK
jgi:serine/threonine-protein kinase HipA